MPAYLLSGPETPHPFADVRSTQRVAELFQTYLAIETLSRHPLADDLRISTIPAPDGLDRPHLGGDEE